jgi:cell division protein ZapA (FtsZ GTPase activity inhibitor)
MPQMRIQLLGREYKLSYEESEEQILKEAVSYVDRNMRDIRDKTQLVTAERIAVLTSIMLAMRLLDPSTSSSGNLAGGLDAGEVRRKLNKILKTIETELVPQEHLFIDNKTEAETLSLEPVIK